MGRELLYYPDEHLKQECKPIEAPREWKDLIEDMVPILYQNNGVGLAYSALIMRRIFTRPISIQKLWKFVIRK